MGPSLAAFGITDALLDPVLDLRDSDGSLISSNDKWKDTQRSQIEGTVFQPNDDRESVIVATLMPANYTAILLGKNNTAGIGLIEVYDNNQAVEPELANISVGCGHGRRRFRAAKKNRSSSNAIAPKLPSILPL